MAYLYSLSMNRKVFKQKVALDNLTDDKLYGSTRFLSMMIKICNNKNLRSSKKLF